MSVIPLADVHLFFAYIYTLVSWQVISAHQIEKSSVKPYLKHQLLVFRFNSLLINDSLSGIPPPFHFRPVEV